MSMVTTTITSTTTTTIIIIIMIIIILLLFIIHCYLLRLVYCILTRSLFADWWRMASVTENSVNNRRYPRTRSCAAVWSLPAELLLHLFKSLQITDVLNLRSVKWPSIFHSHDVFFFIEGYCDTCGRYIMTPCRRVENIVITWGFA